MDLQHEVRAMPEQGALNRSAQNSVSVGHVLSSEKQRAEGEWQAGRATNTHRVGGGATNAQRVGREAALRTPSEWSAVR